MELSKKENAKSDTLKEIHNMVENVKKESGVSWKYMKIFEREQMLREEGIEQGREEEKENTERERRRAEKEKTRADRLEEEVRLLREKLVALQKF